jgi:hypothetical protein
MREATSTTATVSSGPLVEYVDEVVELTPVVHTLLWSTVLLLIASNAAVLAVFAVVYAQNDRPDSLLWVLRTYFLYSDTSDFLLSNSTAIGVGYGFLSGVFTLIAIRMVTQAVRRRRQIGLMNQTSTLSGVARSAGSLCCPVRRVKRALVNARRAIGVRGAYFDVRWAIEEWVELATQTLAAYSASHSISNAPLNLTFAILLFCNSAATQLLTHWVFSHSLVKQRLACVVADLVLDFAWGTLLPVWMYVPIVKRYLLRDTLLDDLASFAGFTRQVERVLILRWRSYFVSLVPFASVLLKLLDLQHLLGELTPRGRRYGRTSPSVLNEADRAQSQPRVHVGRRKQGALLRLAHVAMPLYGLGVLLVSLTAHEAFVATHKQADIACGYRVHPWFATHEACLQRVLNCAHLRSTGSDEQLTPLLALFDAPSLSELVFLDCPALHVTRAIHQFTWLMMLSIQNTTVQSWGADAALGDDVFVDLRTVYLVDVAFGSDDPVGLTGENETTTAKPIASSLEWIYLERVDGNRLLPLVGHHWCGLLTFNCLHCGLTALPAVVYALPRLAFFSLSFNDLISIPDDWLTQTPLRLQMLWLNGNANLTILPDSLWRQAATSSGFSLHWTNLSVVPDWVADVASPGFLITASDTPVCTGKAQVSPRIQSLLSCNPPSY